MTAPPRVDDPYRRRREAGLASRTQTRQRLLEAADELFRTQGYAQSSVAAIAARAGVSLQTLYLAWENKRALLRAATDAAAAASNPAQEPDAWRAAIRAHLAESQGSDLTAAAYLTSVSHLFVRIAKRTGPYWQIHQQAAAIDPEIATDWAELLRARRTTMADVAAGLPAPGLRPDLTTDTITDTLWALASPQTYDLLTGTGGYSPTQYQQWLTRTLLTALCADPSNVDRPGSPGG